MLHETLLMPVLLYGNETIIWKEKERSRIRDCTDGQPQRMGNERIAKSGYVGVCVGSQLTGRLRKKRRNSVNDCLEKKV